MILTHSAASFQGDVRDGQGSDRNNTPGWESSSGIMSQYATTGPSELAWIKLSSPEIWGSAWGAGGHHPRHPQASWRFPLEKSLLLQTIILNCFSSLILRKLKIHFWKYISKLFQTICYGSVPGKPLGGSGSPFPARPRTGFQKNLNFSQILKWFSTILISHDGRLWGWHKSGLLS